jgi:hypothetical protein
MTTGVFRMKPISLVVAAALFTGVPMAVLAQNASDTGAGSAPAAAPAPAAPAEPAAAPAAPAAASTAPAAPAAAPTAPAAAPATAATAPAASEPAASSDKKAASTKSKKKSSAKVSRRQEIERSIDSGTVPSRYRSSVPKEYQKYIPFDR